VARGRELEYLDEVHSEPSHKLRGMRTDLGEIETVMGVACRGTRKAARGVGGGGEGPGRLVAVSGWRDGRVPKAGGVTNGHLRAKLPEHMGAVELRGVGPSMPLLPSGKVNRAKLRKAAGIRLVEGGRTGAAK